MENNWQEFRYNIPLFAEKILGIPMHEGQKKWVKFATKKINILRPGNRWGKSLGEAIIHLWHCMCKPGLDGKVSTPEEWLRVEYQTLNFGPGYEQAREVLRLARDIAQGNMLLPVELQGKWGVTNNSQIKDWAIVEDKSDSQQLPYLGFKTGAKLIARSYSEMGAAFKMKALAFISGDECADIADLWTFTNITLLPRLVSLGGIIHFVGTPQPEGHDYMKMIDMAEDEMGEENWFTKGMMYTQRGTMYDNTFLPREEVERTEKIADENLRRQIIYGEYVETGDKYFGFERVTRATDQSLQLEESGIPGRKYIVTADFAAGDSPWADFTVLMVVDYTEEPYKVVYFNRIKGGDMPIPIQYSLVEDVCTRFPGRLIIDATALGGKNALAFLGKLYPIGLEITPRVKGEMLATLKVSLDGGQSKSRRRERTMGEDGRWQEQNPNWGLLRFPLITPLISELQNYRLDDQKLRQDCVMALAQAIYWIEMRRPKTIKTREVPFDPLSWSV